MLLSALFLTVMVAMAALAIDTGGEGNTRRTDQKVADLAALDSVRGLVSGDSTQTLANASVLRNGFSGTPTATNGNWNSTTDVFTAAGTPTNAVKVTLSSQYANFFAGGKATLTGTSIATYSALAGFQIGSSLISLSLINGLLPSGFPVAADLNAVGYNGLASGTTTVQALGAALGISALTATGILNTDVSAAQVAAAALSLLNASGTNSGDLSTFAGELADFSATNNATSTLGSILGVTAGDGVGLGSTVDLGSALAGALELSNGSAGISLGTTTGITGLATVTVSLVSIVPASLALPGGVGTSATDSQVTLDLNTTILGEPITLVVTGGTATGTLDTIDCTGITPTYIGLDTTFSDVAVTPQSDVAGITLGGEVTIPSTGVSGVPGTELAYPTNFTPSGTAVTVNSNPGTPTGSFTGSGDVLVGGLIATTLNTVMATLGSTLITAVDPLLTAVGLHIGSAALLGTSESCSIPTLAK